MFIDKIATFTVAAVGHAGCGEVLVGFMLPCLIGDVIGGVVLVAVLNHAHVAGEEEERLCAAGPPQPAATTTRPVRSADGARAP